MKKGLKLSKEHLEDLYYKKNLSLKQIAHKYGCTNTNILYWLKKYEIKRRPTYRKKIEIPKKILYQRYWIENKSPKEIAKEFKIKNERTIRKKLEKYGIRRKTVSQALTKKLKNPFKEKPNEKAFYLGLRAGDFHAKWMRQTVRIQTSTTHLAQKELLKSSFEKYGDYREYYMKSETRSDEWFIYIDLHKSFHFLVKKPDKIPTWILEDNNYFYRFLTAYSDCEGNWNLVSSPGKRLRAIFRLRTGDKKILEQINRKLKEINYTPSLTKIDKHPRNTKFGNFKKEMYNLTLNRKKDINSLIENILPLSNHSEKIRKMKFVIENKNESWDIVKPKLEKLRKEIKKEILKK